MKDEAPTAKTQTASTEQEAAAAKGDPDFSTSLVPDEARLSRWPMQMTFWGAISALFPFVLSSQLAARFGAVNTIAGTFAAVVVAGALGGLVARFAIQTGMSVDLLSRTLFGKRGGLITTLLIGGVAMFYAVVEGAIISEALVAYFGWMSRWNAYLIVVLVSTPLVFGGLALFLDRFNAALLPVFVAGIVLMICVAIWRNGYNNAWLAFGPNGGDLDARSFEVMTVYLFFTTTMMFIQDFARFGRVEDERFHVAVTFGFPFFFVTFSISGAVGIFLAATLSSNAGFASETAVVTTILDLLGGLGLVFVVVSQLRGNTINYQVATVNFQSLFRHLRVSISKIVAALCVGSAILFFMLGGVLDILVLALSYTSIFVGAWVAMALVHIVCTGHDVILKQFTETGADKTGRFFNPSIALWLGACGLGLVFQHGGQDISAWAAPVAMIVAGAGYFALLSFRDGTTGLEPPTETACD